MEHSVKVPRVHDLEVLVNEIIVLNAEIGVVMQSVRVLSAMVVEVRYPGMSADEEDAEEALRSADSIREVSKALLGL